MINYLFLQVVRRKKSVAKQEKEVALGKDNDPTPASSTPLHCKLPISYLNILFRICFICTKENNCYLI